LGFPWDTFQNGGNGCFRPGQFGNAILGPLFAHNAASEEFVSPGNLKRLRARR
jgi:hypothetical protein